VALWEWSPDPFFQNSQQIKPLLQIHRHQLRPLELRVQRRLRVTGAAFENGRLTEDHVPPVEE
jgi:hypothetical protein